MITYLLHHTVFLIEQEIDKDALLCLDMNSLKELIPKVGPRMKFFTKLKQYQDIMNMEVLIPDESNKQTDVSINLCLCLRLPDFYFDKAGKTARGGGNFSDFVWFETLINMLSEPNKLYRLSHFCS